jgi:hypothetical protein
MMRNLNEISMLIWNCAYLSISAAVISGPLPTVTPGKLRKEYRERLNALIYAGLNQ